MSFHRMSFAGRVLAVWPYGSVFHASLSRLSARPRLPPRQSRRGSAEGGTAQPALVRIGWPGSPDTLDPAAALLAESFVLFELTYDTMFDLQLDGTYTPSLAEKFEVSDDGTVWTFICVPTSSLAMAHR